MTATPYVKKAPFRTVGIGTGKVAGSEAMAEAPLAEQGALAGQVVAMSDEEAVAAITEYSLPGMVRVATNLLAQRVNDQTDGALRLHANMDDTQYYYEAILRFCSKEDMFEPEGSVGDGWQMPQANYKSLEMFALFGSGSTCRCVARFDVKLQEPIGKRSRASASRALGTSYAIHTGSFVVFKDAKGVVHRATVLTLALYMPNTKQTPMIGAFGGQVVVFAYVFDATAMEWYFVVIFCLLNPVPRLKLTRSASCPAQTVYTQNGVDVKGFPCAVVVDQNCLDTVLKLQADKLDEDLLKRNTLWWQATVMPVQVDTVYLEVQNAQKDDLCEAVTRIWELWGNIFSPLDSLDEGAQVCTSIDAKHIDELLQVNTLFYSTKEPMNHEIDMDWPNVHKFLKDVDLHCLDFLTYDSRSLPSPLNADKAEKAKPEQESSGKRLSDVQVLALNDEQFLKAFVHGEKDLSNNARMAISRLFLQGEKMDLTVGKGAIWARFITLMRDGSVQLPAWVNNVNNHVKIKFKKLAAMMAAADAPEAIKWSQDQVVKLEKKVDALVKEPVPVRNTAIDVSAVAEDQTGSSEEEEPNAQRRKLAQTERPGRMQAPIKHSSSGVPAGRGTRKPTLGKGTEAKIENVSKFVDQVDPQKINSAIDHTKTSLNAISAKLGTMGSDLAYNLAQLTGSSSGPSNANAATENVKLKHKLELAKGALKIMLSTGQDTDASKAVSNAAKTMLGVKDIGFDKSEIDDIFGTSSDE